MASLTARLALQLIATQLGDNDLGSPQFPLSAKYSLDLANGAGLNQVSKLFSDRRTIAASGNDDLDLAGVLIDALGATLTFARVKGILVMADPTNVNNVLVGGAPANGLAGILGAPTQAIVVRPGGLLALFAPDATGYVVTAGTGDILRFSNSGAGSGVNFDLALVGA